MSMDSVVRVKENICLKKVEVNMSKNYKNGSVHVQLSRHC